MSKNIVVGVSGGIAAYKACHLVRLFTEQGHRVHVVPTPTALKFVGAATFEALSGNPVSTSVFDAVDEVRHVNLGQQADLVVIAPATADLLARLVAGRADDLLTATCLVATCPIVVAPAMHTEMWHHAATRANVETLRRRGIVVLEPAHGRLTGKDTGPGRLPEPEQIAAMARLAMSGHALQRSLAGTRVVISAGGTQEDLDPVRYLGNRSSGRQGFALAEVAVQRGADVTVVAGATDSLPTPPGARIIRVGSAVQMQEAIEESSADADIIVMAAAVADVRPAQAATVKLKKGKDSHALSRLELVENPDILAGLVADRRPGQTIVGFAAETGDSKHSALEHAKDKLRRKGCDVLMCNEVGNGKVFGQATNAGWVLTADGDVIEVAPGTKFEVAAQIWDVIEAVGR